MAGRFIPVGSCCLFQHPSYTLPTSTAMEEAVLALSWSDAQEGKQLKGSDMFGFHPSSIDAEEKLLQAKTERSGESSDPRPEIARKGDKYLMCLAQWNKTAGNKCWWGTCKHFW